MRVVIPSRMGGVRLDALFDGLVEQGMDASGIVAVRDGDDAPWRPSRWAPHPVGPAKRLGFAGAADWGIRRADSSHVLLLNDDLLPEEGLLEALSRRKADAPFVGCRILDGKGRRVEFDGGGMNVFGFALSLGHGEKPKKKEAAEVLFASGAAILIERKVYEDIGGYATGLFAYFEDMELGWRALRLGFQTLMEPRAAVRHEGQATSRGEPGLRERMMERNSLLSLAINCPADTLSALLGLAWRFSLRRQRRARKRGWEALENGARRGRLAFPWAWGRVRGWRDRHPPLPGGLKKVAPILRQPVNPAFPEALGERLLEEGWALWQR